MKQKLFLVNGSAGVGKSVLADKINNFIPFSLKIDVDSIKFSISHFEENNDEAIKLALKAALAMARCHLSEGHSVIVDRMIWGGFKTITKLKELADEFSIEFVHILLEADSSIVLDRAEKRGYNNFGKGTQAPEKIVDFSKKFIDLPPEYVTFKIDTSKLSEDEVWNKVQLELEKVE